MAYGIQALRQNNSGVRRETPEVRQLARRGIKGDDTIAHLDSGEMIIPKSAQTSGLMALVAKAIRSKGMNPERFRVGSNYARRNPYTGAQQFGDDSLGGDEVGSFDDPDASYDDPGYNEADWTNFADYQIGMIYAVKCRGGKYAIFELVDVKVSEDQIIGIAIEYKYQPDGSRIFK